MKRIITRKITLTIALLSCLPLLLALLVWKASPEPERPPLRVEWTYWPGFYPMAIAVESGLFEKYGVKIEPLLYDFGAKARSDFSAKRLDGAMLATGDILQLATEIPIKIVLLVDNSAGADQIVAQAEIASVADLRGKRVGYTPRDFGELFVIKMLEQNGLTTRDVTLVTIKSEDVLDALDKDLIDAGNTWEPHSSKAVSAGHHVIFTSASTPGLIVDTVMFHASVVKERPADIRAFVKAWFEAVEFWEKNPEAAARMIAKQTGLKPEEASKEGVKLFTLAESKAAFKRSQELTSVHTSTQAYIDLFVANGMLSSIPKLDELFDPSFLE